MITIRTFGIATQMTFQFIGQQLDVYVCMCEGWGMANQLRCVNGLYEHVLTMDMVIMDMKFTDGWLSVSRDASAPNVLDIYPQWSCWVGEAWQAVAGSECITDILLSSMVNKSSNMPEDTQMTESQRDIWTLWKYMYW